MNEVRFEQRKCAPSTAIRTQVKVLTTSILGTNNMPPNPMYTHIICRHWNSVGSFANLHFISIAYTSPLKEVEGILVLVTQFQNQLIFLYLSYKLQ